MRSISKLMNYKNSKLYLEKVDMINILIGGDICPVRRNQPYFKNGDANIIFNDLLIEFKNADLTIANLECPLINKQTPILKNGPVLGAESDCIYGLKNAYLDILNLANNHIFDHGIPGLMNTLNVCHNAGIQTVGAGENLEAANKILIREVQGIRIAVLGIAEHEFSIASTDKPGANPLSIINYVRNLRDHKDEFDYLIVLVHSGISNYALPSPRLLETCRFLAEMGADAVICQHSHCPGCYEKYKNSFIVYGQGNLVFDLNSRTRSSWNEGYLVKLMITEIGKHQMSIIPYIQSDTQIGVRRMSVSEEKKFMDFLNEKSSKLVDTALINNEWLKTCDERKHDYFLSILFGFINNKLLKYVNRKIPFIEYFYAKNHLLLLENYIRCESHREIIEDIFEAKRNKYQNIQANY